MCTRAIKTIQFYYILYKLLFLIFILIEYDSIYSASIYLLLITILLFCLCLQSFASTSILKQVDKTTVEGSESGIQCKLVLLVRSYKIELHFQFPKSNRNFRTIVLGPPCINHVNMHILTKVVLTSS